MALPPPAHLTMDFNRFTHISFDCYGTLIDWEAGILPVLQSVLKTQGRDEPTSRILELYGEFEAVAEAGPHRSYREVLKVVVQKLGEHFAFIPTQAELNSLPDSVPSWPAFPDTVSALRDLKELYGLVINSNIDDDLFAQTRQHLDVEFDEVVTAQQSQSYKPSLNNFQLVLRRLAISPEKLLHVGQSIYHDVLPAQSLGISTVWVKRKSLRPGIGMVRAASGRPDLEVPDLASLASIIRSQT